MPHHGATRAGYREELLSFGSRTTFGSVSDAVLCPRASTATEEPSDRRRRVGGDEESTDRGRARAGRSKRRTDMEPSDPVDQMEDSARRASARRVGAFISIPRVASNTVRHVLDLGPNRDLESTDSPVIYENHQRGAVLSSRYDLDDLFVFCFARDPYDRCVSWYEYHRERQLEPYRSLSFTEWVERDMPHHWKRQNLTDYQREGLSPLLQSNFVTGCKIDFVGRLETFEDDLRRVVEQLNGRCSVKGLEHRFRFSQLRLNASRGRKHNDSYFSPQTRGRVCSLLRDDFVRFGYPE
jgi:hypothetical protein